MFSLATSLPIHYTLYYSPLSLRRFVRASANFLLEGTVERLHYKFEYADRDLGAFAVLLCSSLRLREAERSVWSRSSRSGVLLIRGENVVALGEIVRAAHSPPHDQKQVASSGCATSDGRPFETRCCARR